MDAARKQNLSDRGKARWADCKKLAAMLDVSASEVQHPIYAKLKAAGLLDPLLAIDVDKGINLEAAQAAVGAAKEFLAQTEETAPRIHDPKRQDPVTPEDKLRLAFWFISKVGDPDEAVRAVQLARDARKKLAGE